MTTLRMMTLAQTSGVARHASDGDTFPPLMVSFKPRYRCACAARSALVHLFLTNTL